MVFYCGLYYNAHYCKKYTYKTTCRECVWKEHDNGMIGKYHRQWLECDSFIYYECELTDDSCGCKKIN